MICFRSDIDPLPGAAAFNRSVYLAALLRHRVPVHFCSSDSAASSWLKARKFPVFPPEELMSRWQGDPVSLVFDLKNFTPGDLELLRWAGEHSFPRVQIIDPGRDRQPVEYTIDGSLQPLTADERDRPGLFGPDYTILHTRFRHFHRIRKIHSRAVKNIFLCPGRHFQYRGLQEWVEFLTNHGFRLKIFPEPWIRKAHKKILKRKYPTLKFLGRVESRARPFFEADLALVPADLSAYEAAACGTPALYFCDGSEQERQADHFEKLGCGYRLRMQKGDRDLLALIQSLDVSRRREMAEQGKKTVDARGVYRIIDFLIKEAII